MNTPDKEPVNTPTTSVAPATAPVTTSDKTSRYIAGAALIAAGLAGYAAYNANQQKPDASITAADTSEKKTEAAATSTASASAKTEAEKAPVTTDNTPKVGENAEVARIEDFSKWLARENKESATLLSHNTGNVTDIAYDKEGLHTFRLKTGYEVQTDRMKGNGACDEICFNLGTGEQKTAVHFEDPNCEKPNTVWRTVLMDYNPEAAGVEYMQFMGLNGEVVQSDMDTTVHVLGHNVPGKSCADLARKTNTGTGTVRIADRPNLEPRVRDLEKKVKEHGAILTQHADTLEEHTGMFFDLMNTCKDPNEPQCIAARKAVRHIESDSAAAERKKDNNPY